MNGESLPTPNQTHFVRCLKCNKILKCSRYDTTALLNHIRTDHPEIEIVDSTASKSPNMPSFHNDSKLNEENNHLSNERMNPELAPDEQLHFSVKTEKRLY